MMAKRRSDYGEWDIHKDEIHKLYIEDDRKLLDVAAMIAQRHGFKRTKAQYEGIVKKWGMKKYDRKEDWLFIAECLKNRKNQGRESEVKIRGAVVPMSKIKKQMSRYEYLSLPYRLPASSLNLAPPHIHVYTPPRSPEPIATMLERSLYYQNSVQMPYSRDIFITWAKLTPWYQFMQFIRTIYPNHPVTMLNPCPAINQTSMIECGSTSTERAELIISQGVSTAQAWMDDVSMSLWVNFDTPVSSVYTSLSSYLPPTLDGSVDIKLGDINDISRRSTHLECIKLAVNLISNNHDTERIIKVIVELTKDGKTLSTLKSFINRNFLIGNAVAEKLLVAAASYQNSPLLRTLVEHGVEIDLVDNTSSNTTTALICAVGSRNEDAVTYLLDHGADATQECFGNIHLFRSVLDFAVGGGKINIINDILTPRPNLGSGCPDITVHTLRLAILFGDISIMNLLMDRNPTLLDQMKSKAWIFSEAAAIHKTASTLTRLQNLGVDIAATNDSGSGSALVAACYHANMPLIHKLLELGADIHGLGLGAASHNGGRYDTLESKAWKLKAIRGKTALQVAVQRENRELLRFLLDQGADPNQYCSDHPLQIAIRNRSHIMVNMLLEAGADVNSRQGHDYKKRYRNSRGSSTYHRYNPAVRLALETGSESIFHRLLEGGAEIPRGNSEAAVQAAEWNPLESAIIGGNQNLVQYIIKSAGYNHWKIHESVNSCISKFGCNFTRMLVDGGIFSAKALPYLQLLYYSIYERDIDLAQSVVLSTKSKFGELSPGYGAAGMALAVRFKEETLIKFFLDLGIKPYDFIDLDISKNWTYDMRTNLGDDFELFPPFGIRKGTSALREAFMLAINDNSQLRSRNLWSLKILMDKSGAILQDMKRIVQNRGILFAYGTAIATARLDIVKIILDTGLNVREIDETIGFGLPDKPRYSSLQRLLRGRMGWPDDSDENHLIYEVAMALLNHGAVPDCLAEGIESPTRDGLHTPLQYAAKRNAISLVRKLLDMGADVNAKPNSYRGATALQFAAINGNFEILNMLLEAGAKINALPADYEGRSAIEGASEWGRLDMVTYLLEAGANVQGRANKNYRRSVYRAWKNGHRCLARKIQNWKVEKFGDDDFEDIHVILESMTYDELEFVDIYAKKRYRGLNFRCSIQHAENSEEKNCVCFPAV